MKKFDWWILFPIPFILVGLLSFGLGIYFVVMQFSEYSGKKETTAIITRVSKKYSNDINNDVSYKIFVKYEIDGKEYQSSFGGYVIGFKPGKKVKIYYDPKNPEKIGNKSIDNMVLMFPVIGLITFIVGCSLLYKNLESELKKKKGKQILAKYIKTIVDTSIEVEGKNPYAIICEWTDPKTNEVRTFKSKPIWNNPEDYIREKNIDEFTVEVNKKDYEVDIRAVKYRRYN